MIRAATTEKIHTKRIIITNNRLNTISSKNTITMEEAMEDSSNSINQMNTISTMEGKITTTITKKAHIIIITMIKTNIQLSNSSSSSKFQLQTLD